MAKANRSEVWRVVPEFGNYEVSSSGFVRRAPWCRGRGSRPGTVLVGFADRTGYRRVLLQRDLVRHQRSVHRLVASAFLGPCPHGLQVNHKNGIKDDNRAENLEWVTPSENMLHSCRVLLQGVGECQRAAKLTNEMVLQIRRKATEGRRYPDLAKEFGVSRQTIWLTVSRRAWRHI